MVAAEGGHSDICTLFASRGVNYDFKAACQVGDLDACERALAAGQRVNEPLNVSAGYQLSELFLFLCWKVCMTIDGPVET